MLGHVPQRGYATGEDVYVWRCEGVEVWRCEELGTTLGVRVTSIMRSLISNLDGGGRERGRGKGEREECVWGSPFLCSVRRRMYQ